MENENAPAKAEEIKPKRQKKKGKIAQVYKLHQKGTSVKDIAEKMKLSSSVEFITVQLVKHYKLEKRARVLLNRIVCVKFCSPSKHTCILLTLPRTNHARLVKPKHDQTSSCQFPEFSNTLAR